MGRGPWNTRGTLTRLDGKAPSLQNTFPRGGFILRTRSLPLLWASLTRYPVDRALEGQGPALARTHLPSSPGRWSHPTPQGRAWPCLGQRR